MKTRHLYMRSYWMNGLLGILVTLATTGCGDATDPVGPNPVQPPPPDTVVASVVVTPSSLQMLPGDSVRLTATALTAAGKVLNGRTFVWNSTNTNAATVSQTGLVTAVGSGGSKIRAAIGSAHAESSVDVVALNAVPAMTALSPDSADATPGIVEFTVTGANFASSAQVFWNGVPRPTTFVSSTELRVVVGGADVSVPGPRTVTVRNPAPGGGVSNELTFRVLVAVASVEVTPASLQLPVGRQEQLRARALDANGAELTNRGFTWSSSSQGAVSVDATGIVTAHRVGPAYIFVSAGGRTTQVFVEAVTPVAFVVIGPDPSGVLVGQERQLVARTLAANGLEITGRPIKWTSNDPLVAPVDEQGRVRGVVKGRVIVRAESEGVVGTVTVEVRQWGPGPESTLSLRGILEIIYWPSVDSTTYVDAQGNSHTAWKFLEGGTLTLRSDVSRYRRELNISIYVAAIGQVDRETWVDEGSYGYLITGGFRLTSDATGQSADAIDFGPGELAIRQTIGNAPELTYHWVLQ